MYKKSSWYFVLLGFILVSFLLIPMPPASAATETPDTIWTKLGRGVANIVSSPVEIFNQASIMGKTERWPIAIFGGIPKGVLYTVTRAVVGVYETATFPFPVPEGYKPIMQPEFVVRTD